MTASLEYVIPEGSLPQSAMQEEISKAYVQMVASAAGVTLTRWDTDYGAVDLTLKSLADYGVDYGYQPQFDIQLKATFTDLGQDSTFKWQVNRRTYEKLTHPRRSTPACLAVLSLPETPQLWLNHNVDGLLARSHMYWVKASDMTKIKDGAKSVSVKIEKSSRLGPKEVLEFMKEASQQWA